MERLKTRMIWKHYEKAFLPKRPEKPSIATCVSTGCEALGVKMSSKSSRKNSKIEVWRIR
jgi:hypothetical protein